MPLETATLINELVPANPAATDQGSQGDDHLRLIKTAVQGTFPNFTGAISSSDTEIDNAVTASKNGTYAAADGAEALPGLAFKDELSTGFYRTEDDDEDSVLNASIGGEQFMEVTSDKKVALKGALNVTSAYQGGTGQLVPLFAALPYFSDTLPSNVYCFANGGTLSRTAYPLAFAEWGTTYGAGDGTTTFNVPDLRERNTFGKSTMGGATSAARVPQYTATALGTAVGEGKHTLTTAELPVLGLTVSVTDPGHVHGGTFRQASDHAQANVGASASASDTGVFDHNTASATTGITASIPEVGEGTAHNIVQPGLVCNFIIRVA